MSSVFPGRRERRERGRGGARKLTFPSSTTPPSVYLPTPIATPDRFSTVLLDVIRYSDPYTVETMAIRNLQGDQPLSRRKADRVESTPTEPFPASSGPIDARTMNNTRTLEIPIM